MQASTGYEFQSAFSHPDFQEHITVVSDNLPSSNPLLTLPKHRKRMFAEEGHTNTAPAFTTLLDHFASAGLTVTAFLHPAQYTAASFLDDEELLKEISDPGDLISQAVVAESLAGPLNIEHQMYFQPSGIQRLAVRTAGACSMNLIPKLLPLQQSNLTATILNILAGRGFMGTLHRVLQRRFPTTLMHAINGQKTLFLLYASLEHIYASWAMFCEDYVWLYDLLVSLNLMHTSWKSPEIADAAHFAPMMPAPTLGTNAQILATRLSNSAHPFDDLRRQLVQAVPMLKACRPRLVDDVVIMVQCACTNHPLHVQWVVESILLSLSLGEFRCKASGQLHVYGQGEKTCRDQRSLLQKTTYLYWF
jgi:hypothetical protein